MQKDIQTIIRKWQNIVYYIDEAIAILVTITEVIVFFELYTKNLIDISLSEYLIKYMLIPIVINWILIAAMHIIFVRARQYFESDNPNPVKVQKYDRMVYCTTIRVLFGICSTVAIVHHFFNITMVAFCIPLFMCIVFMDEKLDIEMTVLGVAGVIIVAITRFLSRGNSDRLLFADAIISLVVVGVAGIVSRVMITYTTKQNLELIEITKKAVSASNAKSDFLARMSHEIRTPINAVIGMDEMILRESDETEILDYANDIRSSAHSLLSIVNDILDISKVESGKMELIPVEYELGKLIREIYSASSIRARDKGLKFEVEVEETLPKKLIGDDIRIRQIANNLVSNAIKYTNEGSVLLKVSGIRKGNIAYLMIMVKDTGIGIKQEDLPRIKEAFKRVDVNKNRAIEGTGLGMKITLELLSLMDSDLMINSEYGSGSEFYFTIEQAVASEENIGNYAEKYMKKRSLLHKSSNNVWTAPNVRILVVDDSAINIKVFCSLLKNHNMIIDTAKSGAECIVMAGKTRYDIIFLDHMMPGMDGIETLERMQKMNDLKSRGTPVVALTANAVVGSREEYITKGFSDYISKPIMPEELEEVILKYISNKMEAANN